MGKLTQFLSVVIATLQFEALAYRFKNGFIFDSMAKVPALNATARESLERIKMYLGLGMTPAILNALKSVSNLSILSEATRNELKATTTTGRTAGATALSAYDWFVIMSIVPDFVRGSGILGAVFEAMGSRTFNLQVYLSVIEKVINEKKRLAVGDDQSTLIAFIEIIPVAGLSEFCEMNLILRDSDGDISTPTTKVYTYYNVPTALAAAMVASDSAGGFFNSYVKGQEAFK